MILLLAGLFGWGAFNGLRRGEIDIPNGTRTYFKTMTISRAHRPYRFWIVIISYAGTSLLLLAFFLLTLSNVLTGE